MKTIIEFISDLSEKEVKKLLFEIYERLPITSDDFSYSELPDKITRYINETHRFITLEEAVVKYIVDECSNGNIGVQDPINFLIASHRMLRHNIHELYKEE